jgi:hypothetical protein
MILQRIEHERMGGKRGSRKRSENAAPETPPGRSLRCFVVGSETGTISTEKPSHCASSITPPRGPFACVRGKSERLAGRRFARLSRCRRLVVGIIIFVLETMTRSKVEKLSNPEARAFSVEASSRRVPGFPGHCPARGCPPRDYEFVFIN